MTIGSVASQPSGEVGAPPPTFHPLRIRHAAEVRAGAAGRVRHGKRNLVSRRRPRLSLGHGSFRNFENAWSQECP